MSVLEVRIDSKSDLEVQASLSEVADLRKDNSKIIVSQRVLGIKLHRLFKFVAGFEQVVLLIEDNAQVVVRLGIFRVQFENVFKVKPGPAEVPLRGKQWSKQSVCFE